ncbi:MAG: restriction endonuclease subunit S [Deltaproteobacteria bacterium]|nr:restriction endonuclease subunit S [Deltaproteobacteria bacterium]
MSNLGNYIEIILGGTPKTDRVDYWNGNIPWASVIDFGDHKTIYETEKTITESGLMNSNTKLLQAGDVIISARGTVGKVLVCGRNMAFNQSCYGLRTKDPNKLDQGYLFYLMKDTISYLLQKAVGGVFDTIIKSTLENVPVSLPSISQQVKISSTLSAYDDLIENNLRRIALLEESARLLYKEWFVRLRFPGYEHTRIINGVPEGWKSRPLSELTDYINRGIAPDYDDEAEGIVINQKCVRNGRIDLSLGRHQSRQFSSVRQVRVGDVLVNSTGEGTLGRVAQLKTPVENCTVDTHITLVRPKAELGIHYFGLAMMAWEPRFSCMGRGATNQTELSRSAIMETEIIIPPNSLVREFEVFEDPIYREISNLNLQNSRSKNARDLLLPCLMSGEIAV